MGPEVDMRAFLVTVLLLPLPALAAPPTHPSPRGCAEALGAADVAVLGA